MGHEYSSIQLLQSIAYTARRNVEPGGGIYTSFYYDREQHGKMDQSKTGVCMHGGAEALQIRLVFRLFIGFVVLEKMRKDEFKRLFGLLNRG